MPPDLPVYPGVPRWVKACAIVALFIVVLFVAVHLCGGDLAHVIDHQQGAPRP